ncbi:MAG: nucleoside hydrolase-like domain-containing protein [Geminicoccaceae bacterium]
MPKPRVIISTDIGGNDKDDAQSFIHALLYSNDMNYRGFVETRSDDGGKRRGKASDGESIMKKIIGAYGDDLSNLKKVDGGYPSENYLKSLVKEGAISGSWPGKLSEGAKHIIDEARAASPKDPLYVLTWGPIHDAARALKEAPDIADSVRIIAIAGRGQDDSNPAAFNWLNQAIKNDPAYKNVWFVNSEETFRGMYVSSKGENKPQKNLGWVKENVKDHGELGELYYDEYTFDLYGPGTPDGLKMGDTPSLLYLLDNANNNNPTANSWGGSFEKSSIGKNVYVDSDSKSDRLGKYDGAKTVFQHRDEIFGDFAERLDWANGDGKSSGSNSKPASQSSTPKNAQPEAEPAKSSGKSSSGKGVDVAEIGVGVTQVELLELDGYIAKSSKTAKGGKFVETSGKGEAYGVFDGPTGNYDITVRYLNENDGASNWKLLADGKTVESWTGKGGNNNYQTVTERVFLEKGDEIAITGQRNSGERARLDQIEIKSAGGKSPAPSQTSSEQSEPKQTSKSNGGSTSQKPAPIISNSDAEFEIKGGRSEIEDWDLTKYRVVGKGSASGDEMIQTWATGEASAVYTGNKSIDKVRIGFLNENDGEAAFELLDDGKEVFSWEGDGGKNKFETVTANVDIKPGSEITIVGSRDSGEYARLDFLDVIVNS